MSFDIYVEAIRDGEFVRVDQSLKIEIMSQFFESPAELFEETYHEYLEFKDGETVEIYSGGFFSAEGKDYFSISLRGGDYPQLLKFLYELTTRAGYCISFATQSEQLTAIPETLGQDDISKLSANSRVITFRSEKELSDSIHQPYQDWDDWNDEANSAVHERVEKADAAKTSIFTQFFRAVFK